MQKENKNTLGLIPELVSESSTLAVAQGTTTRQAWKTLKPVQGLSYRNKIAFTLIELLVVVLIIAILAAIALPQYQLARYKTQIMGWIPLARAFKDAQERHYLEYGTYAHSNDELGFPLPTGCTWPAEGEIVCGATHIAFVHPSRADFNAFVRLRVDKCPRPGKYNKFCGTYKLPMSTAKPIVYLATTRPCCQADGGAEGYARKVCLALGGKLVEGGPASAGEVYEF